MSEKIEYSTLYIDIDCLLDTRLSVLYDIDETAVEGILTKGYFNRECDIFEGTDNDVFNSRYKNRDKTILKNAVMTKFGKFIQEFITLTISNTNMGVYEYQPKILLNIYPYDLKEYEIDVILKALIAFTNKNADIEIINKPIQEITPVYVKHNLSVMIVYEYYKWIEYHSEEKNFSKITCPEVTMIGPAIYFKGPPTQQDLDKAAKEGITLFKAMELLASPLISLKLFPVSEFSISLYR